MRNATFVTKPTIIDRPGQYRTRCGETVTVKTIGRGAYAASGNYSCGTKERWDVSGRVLPFTKSRNDIVGHPRG